MAGLSSADLAVMERWVASGTSSHFPGGDDVPPAYEFLSCAGVRSLSVYPMQAGGRHTGLLAIADADPRPHEPDVVEALELLAAQTATSIGTAESMDDLRRRVAQDPLTGCGNAAAFSSDLDAAVRVRQRGRLVSCLMVDVDGFKQVNDTRGHPAGDQLLRNLVAALSAQLRGTDRLYRVGGDEFAVIALVDVESSAMAVGARLLEAARGVDATVSVGVACMAESVGDGCAADEITARLRSRADAALYAAKRAGRDTSRLATALHDDCTA